jgi:hypothetical protein
MKEQLDIFVESKEAENLFADDLSPFLKWGSLWLFVIGMSLIMLTYFIKSPEIISSSAVLTTYPSPKPLIAKIDAKLLKLFFKNGDQVYQNDLIGILHNPSNQVEIELLDTLLQTIDTSYLLALNEEFDFGQKMRLTQLGELQLPYEQFIYSFENLKYELSMNIFNDKNKLFSEKLNSLKKLESNLLIQRQIYNQDYNVALFKYNTQKKLHEQNATSTFELKDFESIMLSKKLAYNNANSAIIQNRAQQIAITEERMAFEAGIAKQKNEFVQNYKNLKAAFAIWKSKYYLFAPTKGILALNVSTEIDAQLSSNNPIGYILPKNSQKVVLISIPQQNFSFVNVNKEVRVKFRAFAHKDFGVLVGRIKSIGALPKDGNYEAVVSIPQNLTTSYHKKLIFINGLQGEAEIIGEDKSLLERLLNFNN